MRMSDWSSDVCSSDLGRDPAFHAEPLDLTRPPAPVKTAAAAIAVRPMISVPPGSEAIKAVTAPDSIDEAHRLLDAGRNEIGRASCRERVCQYVSISVGAVSLKKKPSNRNRCGN